MLNAAREHRIRKAHDWPRRVVRPELRISFLYEARDPLDDIGVVLGGRVHQGIRLTQRTIWVHGRVVPHLLFDYTIRSFKFTALDNKIKR